MLPITPPTDNLYKFISLFGLTIFLFSLYNLSQVYDAANANEMKMQDIKMNFGKELLLLHEAYEEMDADTNNINLRPVYLKNIKEDLSELSEMIEDSPLSQAKKIELQSEIRKLQINLAMLHKKIYTCYVLCALGIILIIWGFFRWKIRDQNLRDKILIYDFEEKKGRIGNS